MPGWCIQQGKKVPRKVSFRFFAFVAGGLLVGDPQNQLGIQFATRHINFRRRTLGRSLRIRSHAPCSVRLTMFAHAHANSSKRGSFGSPIGALTWGGVFVTFAFPPRSPPQPRSPKGLTRWGTDARLCPYFGEFKTEMYHFFIHVCSEPKFTW